MKRLLAILFLGVAVVLVSSLSLAKSYSVEGVRIDVVVASDGLIRVTEHITYDFQGEFSYAYRDIPLKSGEELVDFEVGEDGSVFERSQQQSPRMYEVSRTDGGVRIQWYYSADDEERTFVLSYTMKGVVRRYADIAEIYHKFVGEGWDRPIGSVNVKVSLPGSVEASEIRAWAHGPLYGAVQILPSGVVSFDVAPLPAGTFWEGRIVCPSEAFETLGLAAAGPRLDPILEEEAAWAEQSNRLRKEQAEREAAAAANRERRDEKAKGLLPVAILLGLAALGVWLQFFLRHGRPHRVASHVTPGEVPSDHPPVAISYLLSRMVTGPAIAATLLDLANRGHLEIRENVTLAKGLFGKTKKQIDYRFDVVAQPASDIRPFERDLLRFVLNEAGDASGFAISTLRKAASKKRTTFRRFFRAWGKEVETYCKTLRFFEPYPVTVMVSNGLCGVVIMASGGVMSVVSHDYVGLPAVAGGFIQAILTVSLTRRTPEGRRLMLAWKAFRSHLKSVSRALGPVTLGSSEWGKYLAAAVVFGLHKKVLPNIRLDGEGERSAYPVWFYAADGGDVDGGVSGLVSGLSSMVNTVSSTVSSAAGAGGGASAGGGGGSGGGGGGAG